MPKVVSQRTCIGCRSKKQKDKLVRLVLDEEGKVIVDQTGRAPGRGAYLCKLKVQSSKLKINKSCLEQAIKKNAFNYAFKRKVKSVNAISASNSSCSRSC